MSEFLCSNCGKRVPNEQPSALCPACSAATAIAKPEHAEQAKVTPPAPSDGAFSEGLPPIQRHLRAAKREANRYLFWVIWLGLTLVAMYWFLVLACSQRY